MMLLGFAASAWAGTYYVSDCSYYGNTASAFQPSSTAAHLSPSNECMVWSGIAYRSLEINENGGSVLHGYGAQWATITPSPAIKIVHLFTPFNRVLVDCTLGSDGFTAQYYWGDNGQNYGTQSINYINDCGGGIGYADGIKRYIAPSRYFGWAVGCWLKSSCSASSSNSRVLAVNGVQMEAEENTGPILDAIPANNLWYQSRWVRGTWPLILDASDPSGVCTMVTVVDGKVVASWHDPFRDPSRWTQCHGSQLAAQLDTTKYPNGPMSLTYWAINAAGVGSAPTRDAAHGNPVRIDNSPITLSLSGPSDAPVTAGTQHVTAVASAGPGGVAGIACKADGSPYHWYVGAHAAIPVQGIGSHRVTCYAENNSFDAFGARARSPIQSWTMTIREPTVFGIGFSRLVDALRCHRVTVRSRSQSKVVGVTRCHAHTVRRRITEWTTVVRNGKKVLVRHTKVVRVVLPPHLVTHSTLRVPFGRGATVNGWLGTSNGTALAGQPVWVLTAADNDQGRFGLAGVVSTKPDGSWSARLRPGPSRLIEALYSGTTTTEPAISGQALLTVPAKVLLSIRPRRTHWGDTIRISGRVLGGYIPVGKLLRLRIGVEGVSGTVGIPDVTPRGRFHTTFTFASGNGTVRYWFSVSTLPEGDYPFAPASSRRAFVIVSPG
jgi:hypothetical protein